MAGKGSPKTDSPSSRHESRGCRSICTQTEMKSACQKVLTSFRNTSLLFFASSLEVSASAVLGFLEDWEEFKNTNQCILAVSIFIYIGESI